MKNLNLVNHTERNLVQITKEHSSFYGDTHTLTLREYAALRLRLRNEMLVRMNGVPFSSLQDFFMNAESI